jgi:ubiquinone biosynthesis protein
LDLRKGMHLKRYRQIADVLIRHGLGHLIEVLELESHVPLHRRLPGPPQRPELPTLPQDLRLAMEELGATFIKLGQMLSTRPDLIGPAYQAELSKLQDEVPPVPWPPVQALLTEEFGRPPEATFAAIERTPLAAASIGQAHAATLPDGADVVVKIRRPGAPEQVEEDLDILQRLAEAASRHWEPAERYDVVGLAQEFAETLRAELDYRREARNVARFAVNFAEEPALHIPQVYAAFSTGRVLTLERLRGIKVDDLAALDAAGIDRTALAERGGRMFLKMVFEDGFFHADPHPGNFFIEPDGRIGLIDFGMVGRVDQRTEDQLTGLLVAWTGRDADRLVDALLALGLVRRRVDRPALRRDLAHLLDTYADQPLAGLPIGRVLHDVLGVVRRHNLQLPPDLVLMVKAAVMVEGLGTRLDASFNLTTLIAPYAKELVLRQYSPRLWARRIGRAGLEAAQLGMDLPRQMQRVMGELERGGIEVGMRPEGFEPVIRRFERLANRIAMSILAGAFVVGLAVLMTVYHPPGWEGWAGPLFGCGFLLAAALGAYLAWAILRSGRG